MWFWNKSKISPQITHTAGIGINLYFFMIILLIPGSVQILIKVINPVIRRTQANKSIGS